MYNYYFFNYFILFIIEKYYTVVSCLCEIVFYVKFLNNFVNILFNFPKTYFIPIYAICHDMSDIGPIEGLFAKLSLLCFLLD